LNPFEAMAAACRKWMEALEKAIKTFEEFSRIQREAIEKALDELFPDDSDSLEHNTKKTRRYYALSRNVRRLGGRLIAYRRPGPREVGSRMGGLWMGQITSTALMLDKSGRGRSIFLPTRGCQFDGGVFQTSFPPFRGSLPGAPNPLSAKAGIGAAYLPA